MKKVLVSSTVYGNEELLELIYSKFASLGFEVWMSYKGTMPVSSAKTAFQNCLDAVAACDYFLGIINPHYGSGVDPNDPDRGALGSNQVSVLRNPTLANVFRLRGYMEQSGRGSILIKRECLAVGLASPKWLVNDSGVRLVLSVDTPSDGELNGELKEAIIAIITANPGIKAKELASRTCASPRTIARYVSSLADKRQIEHRGGKKFGGYYRIG